ncbi:ornithine cyclodeaminase/mu-crystallin family protein [Burkholderia ambifaria AMMD]|uniref:Ornithine cyclodeaminase n=1 Tax=Burkholderia ambifaria (strain ATCC BAA-244 / DSM 16087 / CCUG 44356 / LMG 19182 / AMMD) TaxID=339670 RepID=Q0BHU1_BURCM|nr:ornithine cyclodeaminase family protein [Burkholderia ambifaria]ABI86282.1 ornithine cyclodeaminase [Burkholderia ambifaria AMMD]AJY22748.1 ornithine cyclodeaminase/mu-crystallin family protein [Burkholderia ambifaria AMMD]MBR7934347.1 ornithine cyclodeaminase family protein [Burkholderia ambifaria]PEH66414.1 ornithine cyclodeaminase [Burkholderia ambifaria]QQC03378.1 ornithine cyclodeaminase family protein [Burkholderia ambifaria]
MTQPAPTLPLTVDEAAVRAALPSLDVLGTLRRMFASLASARAVQPPQTLTLFPEQAGDFITYLGALADEQVFGAKLSPYVVTGDKPIVTAWTALMSMRTGQPLMWCDAGLLTVERTAGTTALAVDCLAPRDARRLAVIGTGAVGLAHLRLAAALRDWASISVHSPALGGDPALQATLARIDPRARPAASVEACVRDADVVMLCTSSGTPVLADGVLTRPALVTSISTNVARAHEIPPAWLPDMDVYCDYRDTTPASAGEMQIAAAAHGWTHERIVGDLPALVAGTCAAPSRTRHAFFRSIGLGLEDIAIAHALYTHLTRA